MPNNEALSRPVNQQVPVSEDLPRIVAAQELFAGEREIHIEHEGEIYRLRITRRNKLILQK